jgi:hypothetical protein
VSDELLAKHCEGSSTCFWATMALINPYESKDIYFFDCSMYAFVKKEYLDKVESRLLLSFKSPFDLDKLYYGSKLSYKVLSTNTNCSKLEIEKYVSSLINSVETGIAKTHEKLSKMPKRRLFLRFLIPVKDESEQVRGEYYGLLTKESIIREMINIMGYRNGVLSANVKPAHVLISLDTSRLEFQGLIMGKQVKLNAYRKLIDIPSLLRTLGLK